MKRYCLECGNAVQSSDFICTECGNRLEQPAQVTQVATVNKERKPISKMKKTIVASCTFLLAVLVGLFMYGSSYTSADSTIQRFQKAVFEKDKESLKTIMEYEGEQSFRTANWKRLSPMERRNPTNS